MLTIFSIPEPQSLTNRIQASRKNSINSWRRLRPACEIILFGGGDEITSFALEAGIRHSPEITRSQYGTPLVSDAFQRAQRLATGDVLMFSNCDMLYFDDLYRAIAAVPFEKYVICGRRWDLDVPDEVSFDDDFAWQDLRNAYGRIGRLHGPSGLDFFIFPKTLRLEMPPFIVGRPGWDSWMMWHLRMAGIPVIDATGSIVALHQNHDYTHLKHGRKQYTGPEMLSNYRAAGGFRNMLGLREADWILNRGQVMRPSWPRRLLSLLGSMKSYRLILAGKRSLQRAFSR